MDLQLTDKVAVVTGAGKGIGLAVTRTLAEEGAIVVAGSRGMDSLAGLERVTAVAVDLGKPDAPAGLIARAVDEFGGSTCWSTTSAPFTPSWTDSSASAMKTSRPRSS